MPCSHAPSWPRFLGASPRFSGASPTRSRARRPESLRPWVVLAASCLLVGVASSGVAADWQGREVVEEGVVHVYNPAAPLEGEVTVRLKELWRVGGDSEEEGEFFGVIGQCATDADGNVYLLDTQLEEVKVFSPQGRYLRTIGHEGEGPGEFRNAADMYVGLHGKVGVLQVWPGKIVQLTLDGEPADNFPLPATEGGGFQLIFVAKALDDRVVLAGAQQHRGGGKSLQESYLTAYDAEGNELARYHTETRETRYGGMQFDEKTFSNFQRRWTLAPDGRVIAALQFDQYALHVWRPDGALDRVVHRESTPLERTDREKRRYKAFFDRITRWNPGSTFHVSDSHPAVGQVVARNDKSFWVLDARGRYDRPEGVLASYDVFDESGRYLRRVNLKGEGDAAEDGVFFAGDRVYVVTSQFRAMLAALGVGDDEELDDEPEPDPVSVICYQLEAPEVDAR